MIFLNESVLILLNLIIMYEIIKRGIKNPTEAAKQYIKGFKDSKKIKI